MVTSEDVRNQLRTRLPSRRLILTVILGYGVLGILAIVAIDVLNLGGIRDALGRSDGFPAWFHIYTEGSITEWVQAIGLLVVICSCMVTAGLALADGRRRLAGFAGFLGLGVSLMLLEDTGNVGQRIQGWIGDIAGDDATVTSLGRVPMLALAGGTVVLALWLYRDALLALPKAAYGAILAGFGTYALMAIIQAAEIFLPLYERMGDFIFDVLFAGRASSLTPEQILAIGGDGDDRTSELFTDFVFEESLELIGVAFVAAGCVAMLSYALSYVSSRPEPTGAVPVGRAGEDQDPRQATPTQDGRAPATEATLRPPSSTPGA